MKRRWVRNLVLMFFGLTSIVCQGEDKVLSKTDKKEKSLQRSISYLHNMVPFRRSYENLNFSMRWKRPKMDLSDTRELKLTILARVPRNELVLWHDGMERIDDPHIRWLAKFRKKISNGQFTWYRLNTITVGIDSRRSVIVYHNIALRIKFNKVGSE